MSATIINPLTQQPVTDQQLKSIADLSKQLADLDSRIKKGEELLDQLKDQKKNLSENLIPSAMTDVGLESFSLSDGTKIEVKKFYSGSITDVNRSKAFEWLRSHNFDSLIKRNVIIAFGRGEDAIAQKFLKDLEKKKLNFEDRETVHAQTLKAFIREQMEAGHDLPHELLGVYVGNVTKLTLPSK
jgi:hypothetical protein